MVSPSTNPTVRDVLPRIAAPGGNIPTSGPSSEMAKSLVAVSLDCSTPKSVGNLFAGDLINHDTRAV